ncbi:hypothetical protein [Streptomyces niger]|uniref:hypothetical protein n=1 Tax=Streptomyces niger TaxID=66373 RepID=UPI00069CAB1E|nr:hypothetical protein [Streptomyces niger]
MTGSETFHADGEHEYRAVFLAYELIVDATETLVRHGVQVPEPAELRAAAARMTTLDEALSAIRELGRMLTAVIAGQAQGSAEPSETGA